MTVRFAEGRIELSGDCPLEDAETLLAALIEHPEAAIDLTRCTSLHTAVVQPILAAKATIVGASADPFVESHLIPALRQVGD